MDKLEGTILVRLYRCYAASQPLSKISMWSRLHTMSRPPTGCYI